MMSRTDKHTHARTQHLDNLVSGRSRCFTFSGQRKVFRAKKLYFRNYVLVTKIDSESCREDQMDLSEGRDNNVSSGSVFSRIERAKLELCCSDDLIY